MSRLGHIFLYIVYFGLVIVLAGFITHALTSQSTPKASHPATPHVARTPKASPAPRTSPTPQPPKAQPPGPPSPQAPGTALANSGPGDVVGVFVVGAIAGTALRYRMLMSRSKPI